MTVDRNVLLTMDGYRIVGIGPMPDWHPLAFSSYAVIGPDGAERLCEATFERARVQLEELTRRRRRSRVAVGAR